ncbi:hypothetical protein DFH07DRAFT_311107 [Mycena maculata]|uniref:Transmembrane protein n=1 Tax=Mycena maculata TaxID=230809 RepID=A0AAD7JPT0_9AGAR|nr:hypothetical protein DFH07DRAFT_311107 [Mycena maculata]
MSHPRCHASNLGTMILIVVQCLFVDNIVGLRVWAMYNFSKMVLFFLLSAGLIAFLLAVWSVTDQTWVLATGVAGCDYAVSKHTAVRMAVAWEAQFLCDVVVFGLILLRSYRQPFKIPGSILSYMVRDGALYFAVLAFANLANILMYYFGDPWTASSLSWFTSTISITMVCRLMLNLHKVADAGLLTEQSQSTSVHFQSRHVYRDEESNICDGD